MTDKHQPTHQSSWLTRWLQLFSCIPKNNEALIALLRRTKNHHTLSAEALGMIEHILQVSKMQVREIMIPKAQMIIIHQEDKLEKILSTVTESRHSRFPVINHENNEVVGIILAKDLLNVISSSNYTATFLINDIIRSPFFTPQSKRLDILLREFRINRNHMAIVLDEYGHLAGLVTIEDVLEQIVGDIADEYDINETTNPIKALADGTYIIKASTTINEFNDYFHTHFDDHLFDTIGGIVLKEFGYLPKRDEHITIKQFRFKVLQSDYRRVYRFEVQPVK